ncbi:hypothetical protein J4214_05885 [Candidatus Woesearchaeota archaeon]|nr:hypothetical protein [Candidatus Woesearchaeota archaeon]
MTEPRITTNSINERRDRVAPSIRQAIGKLVARGTSEQVAKNKLTVISRGVRRSSIYLSVAALVGLGLLSIASKLGHDPSTEALGKVGSIPSSLYPRGELDELNQIGGEYGFGSAEEALRNYGLERELIAYIEGSLKGGDLRVALDKTIEEARAVPGLRNSLEREVGRNRRLSTSLSEAQRRSETYGREAEGAKENALEYAFSLFPEGLKRFEPIRMQTSTYLRFRPNREGMDLLNVPLTDRILETVQKRDEALRGQEIELAKLGVRTEDITAYGRGEVEIVLVNNPLDRAIYNIDVRTLGGKSIQTYPSTKK